MKEPRIVVDADVGRGAASAADAERDPAHNARARAMRDTLRAFLDSDARLVLSPVLQREWNRHNRGAAGREFLARMIETQRVEEQCEHYDAAALLVEQSIVEHLREEDWSNAKKDAHLVAAALACGDQRIVSGDQAARRKYTRIAAADISLAPILWADAATPAAATWLNAGAPDTPDHRLA